MNILQAERIGSRLSKRIERVTGVNLDTASYGYSNTDIAATAGTAITFNRQWLANAGRRELQGVLTHELGHVLQGAGSSLTGVQQESYGDALRQRLGFGKGAGYSSTQESQFDKLSNQEFRHLSQQAADGSINRQWVKGASMAGTDASGPKGPGDGNRKRNTFNNILSKYSGNGPQNTGGAKALPSLGPAQTANYYNQLGGLYAGYQNQVEQLKLQRVGIKSGYRSAVAQVRAQKLTDLAASENASIDRGVQGSSASLQEQAGVRGAAAAGIATAQDQKLQALGGTRLAQQQAGTDYFMAAQGLEANKLAQQQELLAQQLQQNSIISGQETQMDALKAIYQALNKQFQSGGGGGGNGGDGSGGNNNGFDIRKWLAQQAKTTGQTLPEYVNTVFAAKRGI